MTKATTIKMLKREKEIICLDKGSYTLFLGLGLELLYQGFNIAKVTLASKAVAQ